jgi:hypothetical protein
MCIETIKRWLGISTDLTIPHPEEPVDPSRTIDNTDLSAAIEQWMIDYNVPEIHRDHWRNNIVYSLDENLPGPAATHEEDGVRHLAIQPQWVNSGVIAHEQAHNSYALLTEEGKIAFSEDFNRLKTEDRLIKHLFSVNTYGLTNDIEGHAEVYRYIGDKMPEELKKYYPKLF